jgi:hypothetical protein
VGGDEQLESARSDKDEECPPVRSRGLKIEREMFKATTAKGLQVTLEGCEMPEGRGQRGR